MYSFLNRIIFESNKATGYNGTTVNELCQLRFFITFTPKASSEGGGEIINAWRLASKLHTVVFQSKYVYKYSEIF